MSDLDTLLSIVENPTRRKKDADEIEDMITLRGMKTRRKEVVRNG